MLGHHGSDGRGRGLRRTHRLSRNEVPSVTDTLVHDLSEIEALEIPTLEAGRIPQYLKANRIVAEALGDKPLFAGCIGPFSLAGRLSA